MKRMISRRGFLASSAMAAACLYGASGLAAPSIRMAYFGRPDADLVRTPLTGMAGLLVEATGLIASEAGYQISHHGYPWARAQLKVRSGEFDALCTNPTEERRSYALFCKTPVIEPRLGLFHLTDHQGADRFATREGLRSLQLGDFIGNGWAQQHLSDMQIQWMHSEELVFRSVAAGRLDGFISHELTAFAKLEAMGLEKRFSFTPTPFVGHFSFTFGLRKTFPNVEQVIADMDMATRRLWDRRVLALIIQKYYPHMG